jgi:hypothetical protein
LTDARETKFVHLASNFLMAGPFNRIFGSQTFSARNRARSGQTWFIHGENIHKTKRDMETRVRKQNKMFEADNGDEKMGNPMMNELTRAVSVLDPCH